jgi:hypothetical protein
MADHRLSWKQLGTGLLSLAVIIGVAVAILTFGRVGTLRGKKFRLYVATNAARGVIRGTEVWLDGQRVGLVKGVGFQSASAPAKERLIIALDVLEEDKPKIRLDSRVQVRAGANIIGDRVVYVRSGTPAARAVVDGDTLRAIAQNDMEEMSSEAALMMRDFPGILENVKLLSVQAKAAEGTLGAFGLNDNSADMRRVRAHAARLFARFSDSTGSFGMARAEADELAVRARGAMARVDSIRALVSSKDHALGRFRRDSTIVTEITHTRSELAEIRRLMSDPGGSFGRSRADSAIIRAIQRDLRAIDSLKADMKKHPLRYIAF